MGIALELRGVCKRFGAGAGGCVAYADVLRDVDLIVHPGEVVAVTGGSGSGKSTLLLCAAGLLPIGSGELRWFGDASRGAAARRTVYHPAQTDLMRGEAPEPRIHLVDSPAARDNVETLAHWIARCCQRSDAVVVATDDADRARHLASHVCLLRNGRLEPVSRVHARVAEGTSG